MTGPRVSVELMPDGLLGLVLPQTDGSERVLPIRRPETILDVLGRVLVAKALGEVKLGQDGNPSAGQARCFAEHSGGYADPNCPWCRQGGRGRFNRASDQAPPGSRKAERRATAMVPWTQRGEVMVRRVPTGQTGAQAAAQARRTPAMPKNKVPALQRQSVRSADDLGL